MEERKFREEILFDEVKDLPLEALEVYRDTSDLNDTESGIIQQLIDKRVADIIEENKNSSFEQISKLFMEYADIMSAENRSAVVKIIWPYIREKVPENIRCTYCATMNPIGNENCYNCGRELEKYKIFCTDYYIHPEEYENEADMTDPRIVLAMCFFMSWYGYAMFAQHLSTAADRETRVFVTKCRILAMLGLVCHILFWAGIIFAAKHGSIR